jgi:hypothetical protein
MNAVTKITSAHQTKIVAVLEDLLERAAAGELTSLAYIAEELELRESLMGVVGRYRDEPVRLLGEMSVMKAKLAQYAHQRRSDYRTA